MNGPYKAVSPYKTRLSENTAYHMALCSKAVYLSLDNGAPDESAMLAMLKQADGNYLSVTGVSKNSAQAALIGHEHYLVYAFRGTDELFKDFADNIRAWPDSYCDGKYHRGFFQSFLDVWEGDGGLDEIYWRLRREEKRPVHITGHSLGGSMATCCAAYMNSKRWPWHTLHTFGSPRVVHEDTAPYFEVKSKDKTYRWQNSTDIVTRLPSRAMNYEHVGTNMFISHQGIISDDPGCWLRFLDFSKVVLEDLLTLNLSAIKDHGMDDYLRAVDKWFIDI